MFKSILLPLLVFETILVSADDKWKTTMYTHGATNQFWPCENLVSATYQFEFKPKYIKETGAYYDAVCGYPPAIGTLMICAESIAGKEGLDRFAKTYAQQCAKYSDFVKPWTYYRNQYENATKYYNATIGTTIEKRDDDDATAAKALPLVYVPGPVNTTFAKLDAYAYSYFYKNFDDATYLSLGLMGYFLSALLLVGIINWCKIITKTHRCDPFTNFIRSHLVLPNFFPNGHSYTPVGTKYISALLPTRAEGIINLGYIIFQLICWCLPYHSKESAFVFTSERAGWQRLVADRSGILAFGKLPLLILFAGRNNFLLWFTGLKYKSFIQFHKVIGRLLVVDAIIHSVAYTILVPDYTADLEEVYFRCGIAATVIGGVIWLGSFDPIRTYKYEIFLYSHILLAIAFIIMCWYHCNKLGWCEWIITACCVWFFDRIVRICTMCTFGIQKAQITLITEGIMKIVVPCPKHFKFVDGQFAYVYFADPLLWFENHPFTLTRNGNQIELLITVQHGITKKIQRELIKSGGKMSKSVCFEGPYGSPDRINNYRNLIFISGGTGTASIVDHVNTALQAEKSHISIVCVQKKYPAGNLYINQYFQEWENKGADISLYLTRESGPESDSSTSHSEEKNGDDTTTEFTNIKFGRPNMRQVLDAQLSDIDNEEACVVACGPGPMMDDLTDAVADKVSHSKNRIEYCCLYQKW